MSVSVPHDVNEPDQEASSRRTDMTEIVRQHQREVAWSMVGPCVREQGVECLVGDIRIDLVPYHDSLTG